jgi:hypothetical protein
MAYDNVQANVNHIIGTSTEQATEISIRAEGFTGQEVSASAAWAILRPHVLKFGESTRQISEKFAFCKYQADVMRLLVQLLDSMKTELPAKSK